MRAAAERLPNACGRRADLWAAFVCQAAVSAHQGGVGSGGDASAVCPGGSVVPTGKILDILLGRRAALIQPGQEAQAAEDAEDALAGVLPAVAARPALAAGVVGEGEGGRMAAVQGNEQVRPRVGGVIAQANQGIGLYPIPAQAVGETSGSPCLSAILGVPEANARPSFIHIPCIPVLYAKGNTAGAEARMVHGRKPGGS